MSCTLFRASVVGLALMTAISGHAQSLSEQWRSGLAGARLTAYSGSVTSSNSTLTVLDFCRNGRYRYSTEGSWSVPGQVGGASTNTITGRWDIAQKGPRTLLVYRTDAGDQGTFALFLQNNGRVNIGGTAYAAQPGGANC